MVPAATLKYCLARITLDRTRGAFTLLRRGVSHTFVAESAETAARWYGELKMRALVTLSEVAHDFSIGQLVGEGNYAKVHLVVSKETGKKYAMKSVNKGKIIKSPSKIVRDAGGYI